MARNHRPSRADRALLAPVILVILLVLGPDARAVAPNFKVYLDDYPQVPLQRVIFAVDAGPTALSTLTTPSVPTGAALEALPAWDFSGLRGEDVVIQVAPVTDPWSCYIPDPVTRGCGFALPGNDLLLVRDNLVTLSRGALALDFDGTNTYLERAQTISEGTTDEVRLCLNPAYYPDVPYLRFGESDARGPYISATTPTAQSTVFTCDSDLNSVTSGARCNMTTGQGGGFDDGAGTTGRGTSRIVSAGTLTLPSGHVVDSVLVELLASFNVKAAACFFDSGQVVRLYQLLWYVPHYGPIAQMVSPQDTASLTAWTQAESTSIGFGLLPPLSVQVDTVGSTSLAISWDPGSMTSFIDEYVVHWGTQSGTIVAPTDSSELRGDTIPAGQTSYTITGLTPGTAYFVSVTTKRTYTDPVSAVTTDYRSIELPDTIGADIDGDGTQDTSYPPEVSAATSIVTDELHVNRQVRLTPPGASPDVRTQFLCGGDLCIDETRPGALPMTLAGEAAASGADSLWMYFHTSGTTTMRLSKAGTALRIDP